MSACHLEIFPYHYCVKNEVSDGIAIPTPPSTISYVLKIPHLDQSNLSPIAIELKRSTRKLSYL